MAGVRAVGVILGGIACDLLKNRNILGSSLSETAVYGVVVSVNGAVYIWMSCSA